MAQTADRQAAGEESDLSVRAVVRAVSILEQFTPGAAGAQSHRDKRGHRPQQEHHAPAAHHPRSHRHGGVRQADGPLPPGSEGLPPGQHRGQEHGTGQAGRSACWPPWRKRPARRPSWWLPTATRPCASGVSTAATRSACSTWSPASACPFNCGAAQRVLLAHLPDARWEEVVAAHVAPHDPVFPGLARRTRARPPGDPGTGLLGELGGRRPFTPARSARPCATPPGRWWPR